MRYFLNEESVNKTRKESFVICLQMAREKIMHIESNEIASIKNVENIQLCINVYMNRM